MKLEIGRVSGSDFNPDRRVVHCPVVESFQPVVEVAPVRGYGLAAIAIGKPSVDEIELPGLGPRRADVGFTAAKLVYHSAGLRADNPQRGRGLLDVRAHETLAVGATQDWIVERICLELGDPIGLPPLCAMILSGPDLPPPDPPSFVQ